MRIPQGQVTADIRLLGRLEDVAGKPGTEKRVLFEDKFKREMAKIMGISAERLQIEAITPD